MRGLNEIGPSISFGSTLGFSSISAIESNSDQFAEFLKYDITLPTVIDPSKLELANAGQLFAPADDWWPRYDVSSVSIADKLTQRFASRYAVPRSLDPFYNTPVIENSAWISSYNNRNLKPAEAADEDLEQPLLAGVNGYNIMGRSRHGGIYGVSFQQSPLSSPEPGAVPLVAALSCVPAIVVFRRRLRGSIQPP
jgi:hypothetical protein